jgi:hypothetical protein
MVRFPRRAVHFSLDVLRARTENKRIIRRLAILFLATGVATLLCGLVIYLLERHARDSDIHSYGLALFWSSSQLLTLGSSLEPVTVPGRILTVAMDVYAVVVIGTISGTLGAYFLHRIDMRLKAAEPDDQDQQENEDLPLSRSASYHHPASRTYRPQAEIAWRFHGDGDGLHADQIYALVVTRQRRDQQRSRSCSPT